MFEVGDILIEKQPINPLNGKFVIVILDYDWDYYVLHYLNGGEARVKIQKGYIHNCYEHYQYQQRAS
jgi:hypothetical protein